LNLSGSRHCGGTFLLRLLKIITSLLKPSKPFLLIWIIAIASCHTPNNHQQHTKTNGAKPINAQNIIIHIQPLDDISEAAVSYLKSELAVIYKADIDVLPFQKLPVNAWYSQGKRYVADTLLVFLKSFVSNAGVYMLGVTGKDICTKKGDYLHWGIMGLGYQPGQCCVISDYRLGKFPQTGKELNERLLKVALHELGHNFGLLHCSKDDCLMTDAQGKDKLNNEHSFCSKCSAYLHSNGFLRQHKLVSYKR